MFSSLWKESQLIGWTYGHISQTHEQYPLSKIFVVVVKVRAVELTWGVFWRNESRRQG